MSNLRNSHVVLSILGVKGHRSWAREREAGCRAGFRQVSMDTNMRPGGFHVIHRNLVTREMGADIIVVLAAGSL